jgi:hypothetical protein
MFAVCRKRTDEIAQPRIRRRRVRPAFKQRLDPLPQPSRKPLSPSQLPTRRRTGVMKAARSRNSASVISATRPLPRISSNSDAFSTSALT